MHTKPCLAMQHSPHNTRSTIRSQIQPNLPTHTMRRPIRQRISLTVPRRSRRISLTRLIYTVPRIIIKPSLRTRTPQTPPPTVILVHDIRRRLGNIYALTYNLIRDILFPPNPLVNLTKSNPLPPFLHSSPFLFSSFPCQRKECICTCPTLTT